MRRLRSDLLSRDSTPVAGDRARTTNSGFLLPRASGFLSPRASGLVSPSATGFLSPRASGFLSPRARGFLSPRASGLLSPRLEAGEMFSPPSSPRQRQTTFGATLDFIEVRHMPALKHGCRESTDIELQLQILSWKWVSLCV